MNTKCPKCGAEPYAFQRWKCCSNLYEGKFHQASPCRIVELEAENAKLLTRAENAEDALRHIASQLSVGGYNAPEVDASEFERKISAGIDMLTAPLVAKAESLAGVLALVRQWQSEGRNGHSLPVIRGELLEQLERISLTSGSEKL